MTEKDQTITPAGEVELNEEELDQATGGAIYQKIPEKDYISHDDDGKVPIEYLKDSNGLKIDK